MVRAPQTRSPEPESSESTSTSSLAERIARAKKGSAAEQAAQTFRQREAVGMGRAFRFGSEFVAAIIVGALIGYGIDALAGTRPWAMIVFLLLGFGAAVLNILRASAEMRAETPVQPDIAAVDDDDD